MKLDLCGEVVSDSDRQPEPPRIRRKEAIEAQNLRIRELTAQGYFVVRGQCGLTVFRWGEELG
jgi:hypothetical protein